MTSPVERRKLAGERQQRRRLARAVRAEQADDLARPAPSRSRSCTTGCAVVAGGQRLGPRGAASLMRRPVRSRRLQRSRRRRGSSASLLVVALAEVGGDDGRVGADLGRGARRDHACRSRARRCGRRRSSRRTCRARPRSTPMPHSSARRRTSVAELGGLGVAEPGRRLVEQQHRRGEWRSARAIATRRRRPYGRSLHRARRGPPRARTRAPRRPPSPGAAASAGPDEVGRRRTWRSRGRTRPCRFSRTVMSSNSSSDWNERLSPARARL